MRLAEKADVPVVPWGGGPIDDPQEAATQAADDGREVALEIAKAQMREQKKPEAIRAQIVDGQLKKWFKEVVLLEQPFRDEERTVRDLVTEKIATIGENIRVRRFTRYALGEEL